MAMSDGTLESFKPSAPVRSAIHKVLPEELDDFVQRDGVKTAQYLRPRAHNSLSARRGTQGLGSYDYPDPRASPRGSSFKMERYRERGIMRWPHHAAEHVAKQPCQFRRGEEVVPLARVCGNFSGSISGEIWSRSLRSDGIHVHQLGRGNQDTASTHIAELFDRKGLGWTGRTNPRRQGRPTPDRREWIEKPVADGKYHLDHMGGSRYHMNLTPRDCVPNSMAHARPARSMPPNTAR